MSARRIDLPPVESGVGRPPDAGSSQHVGRALVAAFHSALRAIRLYPMENTAVRIALAELELQGGRLLDAHGECAIRAVGDSLFVNDTRLRLQLDNYAAVSHVLGRLRATEIGGVALLGRPGTRDWAVLLSALIAAREADDALASPDGTDASARLAIGDGAGAAGGTTGRARGVERVVSRLGGAGVVCFEVRDIEEDDEATIDDATAQERARQTYMRSLDVTRELLVGARMGRSPSLRQAKRAVQGIIDSIIANPTSMLGLTTLREFDDYTFVHSVNVCILSVALGRRIGLGKMQLLDLGLAALMHDIGKSRVPLDVLNKHGALDEAEFRLLQSHSWRGILALFAMRGSAARAWRAMNTAYEHHMRVDLSGYPAPIRPRRQSLFSRIVAIVDGFDAATSTRVYQARPWTPADVVRGMRENPRLGFDPVLVKAFINLTGIYPIGTVVMLDTQELAVVCAAGADPTALARPMVRLLFDARGNRLYDAPMVDLGERGADGAYTRSIVMTEDPDRHGIRVSDYLA